MSELNQRARARLKPLAVSVSFPKPTISSVYNITPSPLAVTVTLLTPNTETPTSPLVVTVTFPAPVVVVV